MGVGPFLQYQNMKSLQLSSKLKMKNGRQSFKSSPPKLFGNFREILCSGIMVVALTAKNWL